MAFKRTLVRGLMAALTSASIVTLSGAASAVPKYNLTSLPIDNRMVSEENREFLTFLSGFMVQQDSADDNLYYYRPAFKAVPQAGGAATALINGRQVERTDQVDQIGQQLTNVATIEFLTLQSQYLAMQKRLSDPKLSDCERATVSKLRDDLKGRFDALAVKANDAANLVPSGVKTALLSRLGDIMAAAGFPLPAGGEGTDAVRRKALSDLSRSNGGVFTANIYAGLSAHDLELVRAYKRERAKLGLPEVRIAKLPVESIAWGALAETVKAEDGDKVIGVPMLRNVAGGGNYEGATINMDLTVDGARAFQLAPPPMILPVYAKTRLIQKYPTFKARLKCDFTTGWSLDGRSDVRDGLVVYNNDVTTNFVGNDLATTNAPCKVSYEGGGQPGSETREAAVRKAYEDLQQRLSDTFLYRSNLAMADRRAYFQHTIDDIQANRHTGANSGWTTTIGLFSSAGWVGGLVGVASQAANFYWHTDSQHISMLNSLKWEQELDDGGNSNIAADIATSICVAFNPAAKVYTACDDTELNHAQTVNGAAKQAKDSPPCSGTTSSSECGLNRAASAAQSRDGTIAPEEI